MAENKNRTEGFHEENEARETSRDIEEIELLHEEINKMDILNMNLHE